jgi:hypothetical protein
MKVLTSNRPLSIILAFLLMLVISACSKEKKVAQTEELLSGVAIKKSVFRIGKYDLQFKPTIIQNAMPTMDGGPRKDYMVLILQELNGANIQPVFGMTHVEFDYGLKKDKIALTEIHDFGSDSPTLEAVIRDWDQSQQIKGVTLFLVEISSQQTFTISVSAPATSVAY